MTGIHETAAPHRHTGGLFQSGIGDTVTGSANLDRSDMAQHVGILAYSAEGAVLCCRTICTVGAALLSPHAHPEVSMDTPPLASYLACLGHGGLAGVIGLVLDSTRLPACAAYCGEVGTHEHSFRHA